MTHLAGAPANPPAWQVLMYHRAGAGVDTDVFIQDSTGAVLELASVP